MSGDRTFIIRRRGRYDTESGADTQFFLPSRHSFTAQFRWRIAQSNGATMPQTKKAGIYP